MPYRKRDISLTLALCLSLTVHAWVVHWVVKEYVAEWATLLLPPLAKAEPIAIDSPPELAPPPPERVVDRMSQLGADNTSGTALADSAGDQAQVAPQATQEQASLSLDPEGTGGTEASQPLPPAPPAFAQAPQPEDATPLPKFEVPGSSAPPPQPQPISVPLDRPGETLAQADLKPTELPEQQVPDEETREPVEQSQNDAVAKLTPSPTAEPQQPEPPPKEPSQAPQQPQSAQRPTPPSSAELPGDPAPEADSESDAFSTEPAVEFRRGKTVARFGRKHRLISPRLEMAAYADLLQLQAPVRIVLRLTIDGTGNVVKADIIKSSGSINLDQPTRQAAYRWWFEPRHDATGQALNETFTFVVGFS